MDELFELAATQYGLFTRADAHENKVTDRMLQIRVRNGTLEKIAPSVYRVRGAPPSWHQDLMAACLAGGPSCVASHRAAAALHCLDRFPQGDIEVSVPRKVRYRREGVVIHQSKDLIPEDCTVVDGIPVTNVERTLIDTGAVTWQNRVEEAFDGAERDNVADRTLVVVRLREVRRQGRNGVGPMARILQDRPAATPHSVLERAFLRILDEFGLPMPECQYEVKVPGRVARIDCAYARIKLGYELDGNRTHATRTQRADDNARAGDLADHGWDIRRFTYEQVMRERGWVAGKVRAALTTRGFWRPAATDSVAE